MVKVCCCALNEMEAVLRVLLKKFRDVHKELFLWEHIVRYQRTRARRSAYGLRRGADNDDLVRLFVGQMRDNMLEEIVSRRYATIGSAEDDNVLLRFWVGVLRHVQAGMMTD